MIVIKKKEISFQLKINNILPIGEIKYALN